MLKAAKKLIKKEFKGVDKAQKERQKVIDDFVKQTEARLKESEQNDTEMEKPIQ